MIILVKSNGALDGNIGKLVYSAHPMNVLIKVP